jgi:hypothetical protein
MDWSNFDESLLPGCRPACIKRDAGGCSGQQCDREHASADDNVLGPIRLPSFGGMHALFMCKEIRTASQF